MKQYLLQFLKLPDEVLIASQAVVLADAIAVGRNGLVMRNAVELVEGVI